MPYKKVSGIYYIRNNDNQKLYIGSAISIFHRLAQHKRLLRKSKHFNSHLQSAWNKYGEKAFEFEILCNCSLDELITKEEYYIQTFSSNIPSKGYNKRLDCSTNLGTKASEETRKKLSISHLGHKRSPEAHKKIIDSQKIKVCQLDKEGNIISTFTSMKEAGEKTGIRHQAISACCRKKLCSTGGFHWCYETELNNFIKPIDGRTQRHERK